MKRFIYLVITMLIIIFVSMFGVREWVAMNKENPKEMDSDTEKLNEENWIGAWTASLQAPFEDGISSEGFEDQTLRFIVQPHIDGEKIRIRLSNAFGTDPLTIDEVYVASSKNGADTVQGTDRRLTFENDEKVTIPPGEKVFSDPIEFKVSNEEVLAISIYVHDKTGPASWHPRSIQTSFISSGNHAAESDASVFGKEVEAWFWLDGVDVIPDSAVNGAVAAVGSSIANGNYSTLNKNRRWPDFLANRFNEENSEVKMSVLNAGVSANQLLNSPPEKGEHVLARLDRDVFSQSGLTALILHAGLNDIRHHPEYSAEKIVGRMREVINAAHEEGLKIYGATLTPFKGSGMYTEKGERTRQEVNSWIRTSEEFDGVIDFDKALRDPDEPVRLLYKFDSGDHLHPNDAGYEKMADSIDLTMFK
ncbi:SGNH/GDSL hydrolase family protein [Sporosarcina jiandibaonis]|uniref:SGNH/GDSL hydrolase family protein n=1 Tax=Sporosarcina jiandibaonis TaxID=2715535 RepID=UPI001551BB56|nr:SGNH/GDSL hydrolase family protein [Sporosarcina jiandibaonis]